MGLVAKETGGGNFSPVPEGVHRAVCCLLADLGTQHSEVYGTSSRKLVIAFELPEERIEIDGVDKPRLVSRQFTLSLHEKSALRGFLEAWRGKSFSAAELEGFDLTRLLGVPCQLQILHRETSGKTYANIASVMPLRGDAPPAELPRICFSLDDLDPGHPLREQIPSELPEWIGDKILSSQETTRWGQEQQPTGEELPAADEEIPF